MDTGSCHSIQPTAPRLSFPQVQAWACFSFVDAIWPRGAPASFQWLMDTIFCDLPFVAVESENGRVIGWQHRNMILSLHIVKDHKIAMQKHFLDKQSHTAAINELKHHQSQDPVLCKLHDALCTLLHHPVHGPSHAIVSYDHSSF